MKPASVRYLVGEGFKNTWANRLMTIASVGVLMACMVIIGLAILITENVNVAVGNLEQQNVVVAYMKDHTWALFGDKDDTSSNTSAASSAASSTASSAVSTSSASSASSTSSAPAEKADKFGIKPSDYVIHNDDEGNALCDEIRKIPNVKQVEFVTGDQDLEEAKHSLIEGKEKFFSFLDEEYGNPLSCSAKVTMTDMALFDETVEQIEALDGVDIVRSNSDLASKITAIKRGIGVAGVWIIAILMIIALVIVSNTIRVTMYTRKLEISIMKAVGATDSFIRLPFVVEGMVIGLISALLAEGILYFCYRVATETIASTLQSEVIAYKELALPLLIIFICIGFFAGILGSVIMISKYLRHEGSEFTAI